MISILIPIYNFEVTKLVETLFAQVSRHQLECEILCFDDSSEESLKFIHRSTIAPLPGVRYEEMPENLGRSAIRNALAKAARYPYLLFMDGDSKVVREDYLSTYQQFLDPGTVLYGGRVYNAKKPADPGLHFHWYYGRQREEVAAEIRQRKPYHGFQTNNFLMPAALFQSIKFDESLRQYGHEDTLFGFELRKRNIPILHIDNPLEHIGLESAAVFLAKTEQGIENLVTIAQQYPYIETRLLQFSQEIQKYGLSGILSCCFKLSRSYIAKRLLAGEKNMRWFDFYKLGLLLQYQKKQGAKN